MGKKVLKITIFLVVTVLLVGIVTTVILRAKHKHVCQASETLLYDDSGHYYKCKTAYCNKRINEKEHELTWVVDKEETCEVNGIKHQVCACGYVTSEGTIIDEFIYNDNIELQDNLTRSTYVNEWDDGNHSPTLELNLGKFDGERNNTSFSARYQRACYLSGEYINGNAKNDTLVFDYPGFTIYNEKGESFNVRLRLSPAHTLPYALEIASEDGGIYKYQSEEITELCKDYANKGFLTIDFGVYNVENVGLVWGFRFKTANCEVSYLSNDSGSLKSDVKVVKWLDDIIISTAEYSLNDVLGFIGVDGIFNKENSAIKLRSRNYTGASRYGVLVSCEKASTWLMNQVKYIEWQNEQETDVPGESVDTPEQDVENEQV